MSILQRTVTTDKTMARDLASSVDALRIAEVLTCRGIDPRRAVQVAELALRIVDSAVYDAAVWRATERIYSQLDWRSDARTLGQLPSLTERERYLRAAVHALRGFEDVLTGLVHPRVLEQAYADYHSHRNQVLAATTARRRMTDVNGVPMLGEGE